MRVLLTGGGGYIGSSLIPLLLAAGHKVRVLDSLLHGGDSLVPFWSNPNFDFRRGDVRDADAVESALEGIDAVVHLAAIVGDPACARQPEVARAVNLDASLALIEAARRHKVARFVFASTCSNYGRMQDEDGYVDENSPLAPVSLYAESKVAVERTLMNGGAGDMCTTTLRFATVFGVSPRMRFDLTVNEFTAEMVLRGRLVVFGEQFWRPYVHVVDAARAVLMVLEAAADTVSRQVFNVGATEENYQKRHLIELIRPQAPAAQVEYVHRSEDPRNYRVRFERIRDTLGYSITRRVPDGIREVAALVRDGVIRDTTEGRYHN